MGGPGFDINTDVVTAAKVGVGTAQPGYQLELANGVLRVRAITSPVPAVSSERGVEILYNRIGENDMGWILSYDRTGDGSYKPLWIRASMTAFTEGTVGIGTPTPGEKLEVNGNVKVAGKVIVGRGTDLGLAFSDSGCAIYVYPPPSARMDISAGTVVVFGNDEGPDGGMHVRIGGQGSFRVRDRTTAVDKATIDAKGNLSLGDASEPPPPDRGGAIKQIGGRPNVGIASNNFDDLIFNYNGAVYWFKGTQGGGAQAGGAQMMKVDTDGSLWLGRPTPRKAIDSQGRCLYG